MSRIEFDSGKQKFFKLGMIKDDTFDKELGFRDIGQRILYSMENGRILKPKPFMYLSWIIELLNYYTVFKFTYNRNKFYYAVHPFIFLAGSLYIPYAYNDTINTFLFSITKSRNSLFNKAVRVGAKGIIFFGCAALSQLASHSVFYYRKGKIYSKFMSLLFLLIL